MGLSEKEMEALRYGGVLHDIGKIAVPGEILNKPGPLSAEEWIVMKTHPVAGYNICLPLKKNLGYALEVIRHHHEKLDGSGYPDGLKDEEISPAARIMAVVDIYDALVTDRPYREGMSSEKAVEILKQEAHDEKLDKKVVEHLIEIVSADLMMDEESSLYIF
jgi:putative two-component system response regulator